MAVYCINSKYLDKLIYTNSADPGQTAPGLGLHCLSFQLHLMGPLLHSEDFNPTALKKQSGPQDQKSVKFLHRLSASTNYYNIPNTAYIFLTLRNHVKIFPS